MGRSHKISESGASLVVDDTHYPFVIATWFGSPDCELIEFYFKWQAERLSRARDEGIQVATIIDALDGRRPSPNIRKTLAEHSQVILGEFDRYIVHNWVIVHSAVARGVLTALTWMTPMRLSTAPIPRTALEEASRELRKSCIRLPPGFHPATYTRPERPSLAHKERRLEVV